MASSKRASPSAGGESDLGPPEKKLKPAPISSHDTVAVHSDSVRRKLQAASRTGQACDRCKERKMRCDPNPLGCGPCKQKNLPCVTTDRISGRPSERGHIERLENEIHALRQQLGGYVSRYGHLDVVDIRSTLPPPTEASPAYTASNGFSSDTSPTQHMRLLSDFMNPGAPNGGGTGPHSGPIRGTEVDVMEQAINIADFDCPEMDEPKVPSAEGPIQFNNSRLSFLNTVMGLAKPAAPSLPEKEQAMTYAKYYNAVTHPYSPVLHCPTFLKLVESMYEKDFRPTAPEKVMFFVVMAIITHQMAVRNPSMAKVEFERSNTYFHYCLSHFAELLKDPSLPSMQALAMLLVHARNLPKPGYSWSLSKLVLTRAVEMNLHRSLTKLKMHSSQRYNPLEIELRKRLFWVILKKVVTSGVKLGRPMPMDMSDIDIEYPEPLLDTEISELGIVEPRSGRCNFWSGLHIMRQIPLWIDLYNNIIKTRKSASEYIQEMEGLELKVLEWKRQCDKDYANEAVDGHLQVATYFVETWLAEFRLLLHHPSLCTSSSLEIMEKNMEICHESALSLLRVVQALFDKFKGADFTWHTTVVYVLAAGLSVEYYTQQKQHLTPDLFKTMQQEFHEWLKMLKIAGAVLGSGDQLVKFFRPLIDKCLKDSQSVLIASTALRNTPLSDGPHGRGTPNPHNTSYGQSPSQSAYHDASNRQAGSQLGARHPSAIYSADSTTPQSQTSSLSQQSYSRPYDSPRYPGPTSQYSQDAVVSSSAGPYNSLPSPASHSMMFPAVNLPPYGGQAAAIKQEAQQHANTLLDLSQSGFSTGFVDDMSATGMWPNLIWQNGP